jgi:hypothetical protein
MVKHEAANMTRKAGNLGIILLLASVAGAIAQLVGTGIEIGRTAGWWP